MNTLISIHDATFDRLENAAAPWLLPTLARFTFAATLMLYFWNSGLTKLGSGLEAPRGGRPARGETSHFGAKRVGCRSPTSLRPNGT